MYNFNYHRPSSLADAAKTLQGASEGKLVAGGMTLIPTLKQRLAKPSDLIDLARIPDLKGVKKDGNTIVIGAMTKHVEVATSDVVKGAIPALAALPRTCACGEALRNAIMTDPKKIPDATRRRLSLFLERYLG